MITYNHEKYIAEAINGVLIQECNFDVELIIADDNSPDNTETVVQDFLKCHPRKDWVKYIRHKENKGMHGNVQWALSQAEGKFIAQCEGDDYWTDPLKLQKQINFLEHNPEYGLIYSKTRIFDEKNQKFWTKCIGTNVDPKRILYENPIPSLTAVYRSDLSKMYLSENKALLNNWLMGDYPKWIWFYYNSKIHFADEIMAVYRKLENSASNFIDKKKKMAFKGNSIKMQTFYAKKYLNNSEYYKLKSKLFFNYYFTALILNPTDSVVYYNEIQEIKDLLPLTKLKIFTLEKLKFKYLYFTWFESKKILKHLLKTLGFKLNGV